MSAVVEPAPDDRPFAVVDIGSNSGRMIVFRLREGEHLILCTDGIHDALEDNRIADIVRRSRNPHDAADALVQAALAADGRDNLTAIVVELAS